MIRVDNNKVYIAAGSQHKLKQGDSLVVYAVNLKGGLQESQLIGVVNIKSIQANFAVGAMEVISDARKIKKGDIVKSW